MLLVAFAAMPFVPGGHCCQDAQAEQADATASRVDQDLEKIGVLLGHRRKIRKAIAAFNSGPAAQSDHGRSHMKVLYVTKLVILCLSIMCIPLLMSALSQSSTAALGRSTRTS